MREGGREPTGLHRGSEGGYTGEGGVRFWNALTGEFYLADDRSSVGHKQFRARIPLVVNERASVFKVLHLS